MDIHSVPAVNVEKLLFFSLASRKEPKVVDVIQTAVLFLTSDNLEKLCIINCLRFSLLLLELTIISNLPAS